MSEAIMNNYGVSQDEYIFRLYSLALVAISMAAAYKGDLAEGLRFMMVPGTLSEINEGLEPTWSVMTKFVIMFMFSTTGFLGSSCSAAITKQFGAMTMSITSTVRKATTLFLSFALFNNYCTIEHVGGIVLFLIALIMKTVKHSSASRSKQKNRKTSGADVHMGGAVEVPRVISAHHVENEHIV
jgi:small neutral amino acid transporter SnatA (MarC family)